MQYISGEYSSLENINLDLLIYDAFPSTYSLNIWCSLPVLWIRIKKDPKLLFMVSPPKKIRSVSQVEGFLRSIHFFQKMSIWPKTFFSQKNNVSIKTRIDMGLLKCFFLYFNYGQKTMRHFAILEFLQFSTVFHCFLPIAF